MLLVIIVEKGGICANTVAILICVCAGLPASCRDNEVSGHELEVLAAL